MGHAIRRQLIAAGASVLTLAVGTGAQSPAKPSGKADGLLHTELSLVGRTASISFAPDLRANDAAYRNLFASPGQAAGRVRLGQLETNGALRLGNVAVGKPGTSPLGFDLSIEAASDGWQLEIVRADASGSSDDSSSGGKVALSRQPSAVASPTLVAALVPVTLDTAQLVLTWGNVKASAVVQFQEAQAPQRPPGSARQPPPPVSRKHDDENAAARLTMLSQMNETALVDPQGARVSVTFARTFPKGTQSQSAAGTTRRPGLVVEGADFGRLMSTRDGAVVEFTEAPALRLTIDRAVRAGKVMLRPGNQAPAFPGAYSLWLKRAGSGWRLVFNQEPDVWGSQRDPKSDLGEVDLTYSKGGEPSRPLGVALEPTGADRWRMVLAWGPHEWAADFTAAQ
jgi:hypothetical protein